MFALEFLPELSELRMTWGRGCAARLVDQM